LNFDLHRTGGMLAVLFLLTMTITGLYFAFATDARTFLATISGGSAKDATRFFSPPRVELARGAARLDSIMARFPNASLIALPRKASSALVIDLPNPGNRVASGVTRVFVHPATGETLDIRDARREVSGIRLSMAAAPVHFGEWGGCVSKLLWCLLGLTPGALFLSGFLMWWTRVRMRAARNSHAVLGQAMTARRLDQP
jgi:uncharacterized iron-regulated membrane protein